MHAYIVSVVDPHGDDDEVVYSFSDWKDAIECAHEASYEGFLVEFREVEV